MRHGRGQQVHRTPAVHPQFLRDVVSFRGLCFETLAGSGLDDVFQPSVWGGAAWVRPGLPCAFGR